MVAPFAAVAEYGVVDTALAEDWTSLAAALVDAPVRSSAKLGYHLGHKELSHWDGTRRLV